VWEGFFQSGFDDIYADSALCSMVDTLPLGVPLYKFRCGLNWPLATKLSIALVRIPMQLFRSYAIRSFWLLAYLFVAQVTIGNVVLCFDPNGDIAVETGECPCRDHQTAAANLLGATEAHLADSCRDLVIDTDAPFFPQDRQSLRYWSIESVHPLDQAKSLFAPVSVSAFVPNYDAPPIHPSVHTAVLLI
jgi:hypothetical protein